jgi:signal transduction histidine kinase
MAGEGAEIRVLHVDDDPQYAEMLAGRLSETAPLSVATEAAAADALERLEAEAFDCVVSDYRMPDATGVELARRVRDAHPDVPIILLTGEGSEQVASDAISAGVTDYFRKGSDDDVALLANRIETAAEKYRAEVALREERRRSDEFARLVAHDLRNPMAVARGWLDVVHETGEEVPYRKAVTALDRMDAIVDNLETLARSGDVDAADEGVELSAVATAAWELVDSGEADLRVEYGPEVVADPSMLQQALENLFANAVEHGSTSPRDGEDAVEHGSTSSRTGSDDAVDHGGEDVTVRVGTVEGGFYVSDDGVGIDPADRKRVFESGYTADGGTGLGLAIVDRIAAAHGWDVSVEESETGGARFEFSDVELRLPETAFE